ncbi:MAG: trehalose-phosphatase [Acidobacteriota bacterium]|nr:trehalose-phosphatase [Acidobacteriota bacterium]
MTSRPVDALFHEGVSRLTDAILARARPAIARDRLPILLLSDFDGTLCEFTNDPASVYLNDTRRDALSALSMRTGVLLGIVSGRRVADIRERTGLAGPVYYAGLHGMEIEGPDTTFTVDALEERCGQLQTLATTLAEAVRDYPGALVENKQLSVAVHMRAAAPEERSRVETAFWSVAGPALESGGVRVQRGQFVFELLPNIAWNKGNAVRWIEADATRRLGTAPRPVYFGDDRTDEHAFEAIGTRGITVIVGERTSQAMYRLAGPQSVEQVLAQLVSRTRENSPDKR